MTVVVWDGETLAADRQASQAGRVYSVRKLYRIDDDRIAGCTGTPAICLQIVEWLRSGGEYPKVPDDDGSTVVVIHRDGRILRYEISEFPVEVMDATHTAGGGCDFAEAALACGRNAVEAVEIAMRFSSGCGLGVDVMRFE